MTQFQIAAVLFEGFDMLDLYGPLGIYAMRPDLFHITAIADSMDRVCPAEGPCALPEDTFADIAPYDILLVPGGNGTLSAEVNPALLGWLAGAGARAQVITSVCTGAVLLAKAGLLDGHAATTSKSCFDAVAAHVPQVEWRRQARWVASGNRFTASGASAGMDMTLAVIETLAGSEIADAMARDAEYTRNRDPDHDPFAQI